MIEALKKQLLASSLLILLLLAACGQAAPACPPTPSGEAHFLTGLPSDQPTPIPAVNAGEIPVNIGNRTMQVDRVVEGPLCNDHWSGTVYVTCDVQVYKWVESPLFLKDCKLTIDLGTVVYVAWHNNTAYYNGCSCHTGEIENP